MKTDAPRGVIIDLPFERDVEQKTDVRFEDRDAQERFDSSVRKLAAITATTDREAAFQQCGNRTSPIVLGGPKSISLEFQCDKEPVIGVHTHPGRDPETNIPSIIDLITNDYNCIVHDDKIQCHESKADYFIETPSTVTSEELEKYGNERFTLATKGLTYFLRPPEAAEEDVKDEPRLMPALREYKKLHKSAERTGAISIVDFRKALAEGTFTDEIVVDEDDSLPSIPVEEVVIEQERTHSA